jgi:nicotinate-nucleotide pyrophosphorylase (carboxylating)
MMNFKNSIRISKMSDQQQQLESSMLESIRLFLKEDIEDGDITSIATIPLHTLAIGNFLAKSDGVIAGIRVVELVFAQVDSSLKTEWKIRDGDYVKKGDLFGVVQGSARSIVIAERLALNLMQRMSGIATLTRDMVNAVRDPIKGNHAKRTRILDTRKTAPGLRVFDKFAVKLGGGCNHRFGLFDMVLIKDNHVTAAGGVKEAVLAARELLEKRGQFGKIKIELETRTLEEVKEAMELRESIDRIMLDNMVQFKYAEDGTRLVDTSKLEDALEIIQGKLETEVSGNVTLESIPEISKTGVDYISSGALTHSVTALDISLKIKLLP